VKSTSYEALEYDTALNLYEDENRFKELQVLTSDDLFNLFSSLYTIREASLGVVESPSMSSYRAPKYSDHVIVLLWKVLQ
jgi:hypothetical protein